MKLARLPLILKAEKDLNRQAITGPHHLLKLSTSEAE